MNQQNKPNIVEDVDLDLIDNIIVESKETNKPKKFIIRGPFFEANKPNKNKRIYPKAILESRVERYINEFINTGQSVGELNHPPRLTVLPEEVSHRITNLQWVNETVCQGEAIVGNTPKGLIVKDLMEMGAKLGVSSRGNGTLKESDKYKIVQDDYIYITHDIVFNPSVAIAFVDGIFESKKEWLYENGILTERDINIIDSRLQQKQRNVPQKQHVLKVFETALDVILKPKI